MVEGKEHSEEIPNVPTNRKGYTIGLLLYFLLLFAIAAEWQY